MSAYGQSAKKADVPLSTPERTLPSSQRKLGSLSPSCQLTAIGGWVYIMSNERSGVLYIGVTADLPARIMQHKQSKGSAFCRRYGLDRLVYAEPHAEIVAAIAREKAMKAWKRAWKIEQIEKSNPEWGDLFEQIN